MFLSDMTDWSVGKVRLTGSRPTGSKRGRGKRVEREMEREYDVSREAGKRELILAAAQEVFARRGFHQATVEEVAEVAGVGKGTVYLYFASKKELLVALVEERLEDMKRALEKRLEAVGSATDKLREAIALHFEVFSRSRDFLTVVSGDFGDLGRELDERTKEARRGFLDVVEAVIREGVQSGEFRDIDPRIATYAIEGMISLVAFGWLIRYNEPLTEEHVSQIIDLCLHGVTRSVSA